MAFVGLALRMGEKCAPFIEKGLEGKGLNAKALQERLKPHLGAGKALMKGDKATLSGYHKENIAPRLNSLSDYSAGLGRGARRVSARAGKLAHVTGKVSRGAENLSARSFAKLGRYGNENIAPRLNSLSDYSSSISNRAASVSGAADRFADIAERFSGFLGGWAA